ncbi:MAG: DMT family transporter [Candidatus Thorarchaeota archaeon]|nr:DMT family transporter [Candidatus Thorarchaeota archaeon]
MQTGLDIFIGSAAGLLASILYAISVVLYRSQSNDIHPIAVSSIKMWVSVVFMTLLILLPLGLNPFAVPTEAVIILALSIFLGAVVGDTLYLMSQERIGVTYAFPIAMTFPILTFIFTITFLNEPVVPLRIIGAVIAVAGTIVLALEQNQTAEQKKENRSIDVWGILLAVITSVLYALGTTLIQVGLRDYNVDSITANFIRMVFGGAIFIPIFLIAHKQGMAIPSRRVTKLVAIAGFFGMAIGALLYVYAIQYAGAAISSVVASTAPLFAVPISIHYLHEQPTRKTALGVIATVIGVVLVVLVP